MMEKWNELAPREQALAIISAIVLLAAGLYWGLYAPMSEELAQVEKKVANHQKTLTWMKANGQKVAQAKAQNRRPSGNVNLNQVVGQSARNASITLSRIQPKGKDLEVWIDNIEFNKLLHWLDQLSSRYGVKVINTDLATGDAPGTVKVRKLHLGAAG